jgi:tetratricopeptide (TPR) repeat protein
MPNAVCCAFLLALSCFGQTAGSMKDLDAQGKALIQKQDLKGAEDLYRAALDQARAQGDQAWEAEFNRAIGETFQRRRQYKDALPFYEQSLALRKARGDRSETAYLLAGIGNVHLALRNDEEAQRYLEQGLAAYRELGDKANAATVGELLGNLKMRQGKLNEAELLFNDAIGMVDTAHNDVLASRLRVELADVYRRRSDYGSALQRGFEALEIQRRGNSPAGLSSALELLASIFRETEQMEKALSYYRQCLELRIKIANPQGISQAYNNIGFTLDKLGRHQEALDMLSKALEMRRASGNPADVVETLINIANAQASLGNTAEAAASFEEARKVAEARRYSPPLATALYGLGNLALSAGKTSEAIDFHDRALKIRKETGDRIGVVHSMNRLALAYEGKGDLPQAEKLHAAALEDFEKIAAGISDPVQVGRFRANTVILYPHYSRVLLKEGKTEEAFAIAERSRGAGLARMSELTRKGFLTSLGEQDRASWTAATVARSQATNRLRDALAASDSSAPTEKARADYLSADNALEQLRDRIYAAHPDLASRPQPAGTAKILAASRAEPSTLYLEWLMVDDSSALLFALSNGGLRGFELSTGRGQIAKLAARWRSSFAQGIVRGVIVPNKAADPKLEQQTAHELYAAAFGPLAAELAKKTAKRIVLVPDGPMLDVPFAALVAPNGARLIDDFPLASAVSLESVFAPNARKASSGSLLAVGDPFESNAPRMVAPSGDLYAPLAHARAEAESIAKLFPQSTLLIGGKAAELQVKSDLGRYEILHFATHGILSSSDGMQSGLLLANELADGKEDGLLQAWEIADIPLSAKLAVLSACQTAEGDERLGEGLMGLAWAFQAAGCPNVVASLWNIDDEATRSLMLEFYKAVRAGRRLDEALRLAMLQVKGIPGNSSPYYWAGFRVV